MSDMAYFAKFSAKLYLNQKVQEFADEHPRAAFLWVNAITYCVDLHTDGVVTEFAARRFLNAREEDLQALMDAGFLEITGENEYLIHDYAQAQVTSDKREELRVKRAEAGRKGGMRSARVRGTKAGSSEANAQASAQASAQANVKQMLKQMLKQNEADKDIDIDIDKDIYKENNKRKIQGDNQTPEPTSEHDPESLTVSSQALSASNTQTVERITQQLRSIYPAERYDADSTHCQFVLENAIPRISKAAGTQDPADWFINRTRAYLQATERRYVKKFSRYIDQQIYLQAWEQATKVEHQPTNKSQAGLQHNISLAQYYEARGD